MSSSRPFAWVEIPPTPGSPAAEAGLGVGDGIVAIGSARSVNEIPSQISEGVPVPFVVVSPIDFGLVHLTVIPRRFDPTMPHSLLGCQLVDSPAGFADPRIRAYGSPEGRAKLSDATEPAMAGGAPAAGVTKPVKPTESVSGDDAPAVSSRIALVVCCLGMTLVTSLMMRAPMVVDAGSSGRAATRPILSSEMRYMLPLVCHMGEGNANAAAFTARSLSEMADSSGQRNATAGSFSVDASGAPPAGSFPLLPSVGLGAPRTTLPPLAAPGGDAMSGAVDLPSSRLSMQHVSVPAAADEADADEPISPPPFQRAAFSIAWLQLLVSFIGMTLAVTPSGSMGCLRNFVSIAFPVGALLMWLLMTAAAMYCLAFRSEASSAIHAYWRCLRPELTTKLIRERETRIRDVTADLLTDANATALLCCLNGLITIAALIAGCYVISWRRVLRAALLVGSAGSGIAGFVLASLGTMLHIDGVLAPPLDVLLICSGLFIVLLSMLGLCAALHEHRSLLQCYATMLLSSATALAGVCAYVFAEGLAALQGFLDRLGVGLTHAGLGKTGADGQPVGLRAQEVAQLVQANRLSFALASVVVAFVLALNVALACGLRQTLRSSGSGGAYGTVSLLLGDDSDDSNEEDSSDEELKDEDDGGADEEKANARSVQSLANGASVFNKTTSI